jgi:hypothetical protein
MERRWESNPRPHAAKRLKTLVQRSTRASNSVQNRGDLFDGLPLRISHKVSVNLEGRARIGVSKLPLDDFQGRRADAGCAAGAEEGREGWHRNLSQPI